MLLRIICVQGYKTTCASKILDNSIPPYGATAVNKLEQNNAIFLGKLNMDEFAMGSSNGKQCSYESCKNPWDRRVPGGSTGGSAAVLLPMKHIFSWI